MGALDYSRFDHLDASSSSSSDDEDTNGNSEEANVRSGQGLLRAFTTIHERRIEVDQLLAAALPKETSSAAVAPREPLLAVAAAYDDIGRRLLALDGVQSEAKMRSLGHRAEAVKARLGAARAFLAMEGDSEAARQAEARTTSAIEAMRLPPELQTKGAKAAGIPDGKDELLHVDAANVHLCRARARARLCEYSLARGDALEAYSLAKHRCNEALTQECEQLAIRCEMAMHAGGPGPTGDGEPLDPGELDELELGSLPLGSFGIATEGAFREFEHEDADQDLSTSGRGPEWCDSTSEDARRAQFDMDAMD